MTPKPATPLPWEANRRDDSTRQNWICTDIGQAMNYGGLVVTRTLSPGARGWEDAAYIVAACNAYPALVERIKELEGALSQLVAERDTWKLHAYETKGFDMARAALNRKE